ncbi:MAG: S1C family serine protease, partial [Planctomycetaceae bacterium]|nr:S1C family serine protease [Planctomycetaceae bacterium]
MLLRIVFAFYLFHGLVCPVFSEDRNVLRQELLAAAAPFEQLSSVLRRSAEFAAPSIVHIEATQVRPVNPSRTPGRTAAMQVEESGSGIIAEIAGKQVILTNRHVVAGVEMDAVKIETADRRILTPKSIITNTDFDLAVISVAETLPVNAVLGDCDKVQTGDFVLAFGSPFGLKRSVSFGIISAVNRRNIPAGTGESPRVGFFQIDAAVNPGSSGGPMLNLRG